MDPSIREKYDVIFNKVYLRPINRKESKLVTVIIGFLIIQFFFTPLLILVNVPYYICVPVALGGLILGVGIGTISEKKDSINAYMDCSFILEFILSDKVTREEHPGYVFVEGYNQAVQGTASVINLNSSDEFRIPGVDSEQIKIHSAVQKNIKANVNRIRYIIHAERFQQMIVNAVLRNQNSFMDFNFSFFEAYRLGKRKFDGRYCYIKGMRGLEKRILIPSDCGFI